MAKKIYGPSYVTAERALAFWGLIPEGVVEVREHDYREKIGCGRSAIALLELQLEGKRQMSIDELLPDITPEAIKVLNFKFLQTKQHL